METRTVEQVESWGSRSFSNGYAGLQQLSDGEFSGAVRANGAWLFMLNGRIIGVYEGSLDDFENADGTAYSAPHPSLPLLFSMQERGGETQAKYYTNDKPLSEVDSTLSEGKFTGYVELSENVLSGDYYVAYYGGRSMSVAFVGASEQVVSGEEAYERAADEVGIYEVRDVDLEIIDVPEPEDAGDSASGGSADQSDAGHSTPSDGQATSERPGRGDTGAKAGASGESQADATTERRTDAATDSSQSTPDGIQQPEAERGATANTSDETASADAGVDSTPANSRSETATADPAAPTTEAETATTEADATTEASTTSPSSGTPPAESASADAKSTGADAKSTSADSSSESDDAGTDEDAFSAEKEWRETTTIPSLDPDRSPDADESNQSASESRTATGGGTDSSPGESATPSDGASAKSPSSERTASTPDETASAPESTDAPAQSSGGAAKSAGGTPQSAGSSAGEGEARERIQKLRSQLEQRKQQVQRLKERLSTVETERNEYERERDALRQEVERLEAKLESTGTSAGGRELDRAQAFDGTNLFVRYESKGDATLEEAAEGEAARADVNANLRLEHHTQFEAADVTVDGESFDAFLTDSFEYQFVSWLVEDLLYEIRETGHQTGLKGVYEAIPRIDRVDLHGSVDAGTEDDETRTESFDVIVRDRMGNPLLVADLNDSRDPTTGRMMESLVDASTGVAEACDELAGSFQVTASFFEPPALETAEDETNGGLLSRGKKESFVKLSRKRGYHLCLVESRSGGFHLTVPEL